MKKVQLTHESGTIRRLWQRVAAQPRSLALIIILAITGNILTLSGPLLLGQAIDLMPGPGRLDWSGLSRILLLMGGLFIAGSISQWLLGVVSTRLSGQVIHRLRQDVGRHLDRLPLRFFDQTAHGDITSRLSNDMDAIGDGLINGLSQAFSGLVTLVGSLVIMLILNPWITLFVLALTPVSFKVAAFITRNARQMYREQSRVTGELNGLAEELIENHALVRAFGAADASCSQFDQINARLYTFGRKAQYYSSLTNPSTRLVNATAYIGVGVLSSIFAVHGIISVGRIASFLGYTNQFARPINEITSVAAQLQSALASARRVFDLLDQETEQQDAPGTPDIQVRSGAITLQQVDFSYHAGQHLIENLNMTARPGSLIAIVGPTGAGKTTLVNLLMRFYDVSSGRILIDGQEIRSVGRNSLRQAFGMVLQDVWLFRGTVRENIAFARPEASAAEVETAAQAAGAHGFIRRLPAGYDTEIGGPDGKLSAGQQQLLTIARTMLADSPLLILDEATSNVDTRTEVKIQRAFRQLMKGRTSFVIAHRLSTILDADHIIVMDQGRIVEQGTHAQLLAADGFYAGLYHSQYAGEDGGAG